MPTDRDNTTYLLLRALREHMAAKPPEIGPGATPPFEAAQRAERALLHWEEVRDSYHLLISVRLLRACLENEGIEPR